VKAEILISCT